LKEELDIISEASNKATGIIRQLMSLSKNQNTVMETVDLSNEISQVVSLCKTSFPKNIEFILNIPETPAFIEASMSQISQMILNLLVNAKDSVKGQGVIEISLKDYVPDVFRS
jgi:two-component system NtrC family sensor kinase